MTELFHYTCSHGRRLIGEAGLLVPGAELKAAAARYPWCHYVWLTDLAVPARAPLGLTGLFTACDRTEFRYQITDASSAQPWMAVRKLHSWAPYLEAAEGARPRHWWVSAEPISAVLLD